jgi:hypothetical protein
MLRKITIFLAVVLVFGGSAPSSGAFAHGGGDRGYSGGRRGRNSVRGDAVARGFGGHRAGDAYNCYGGRVGGLCNGFPGYEHDDVWGHWGAYYGPMIP